MPILILRKSRKCTGNHESNNAQERTNTCTHLLPFRRVHAVDGQVFGEVDGLDALEALPEMRLYPQWVLGDAYHTVQ